MKNKKINYFIANNIRFLSKTIEQHKYIQFDDEDKRLTKEKVCKKYGINELTYNRIVKNKIYTKPPKFIQDRNNFLDKFNNDEFIFICNNMNVLNKKYVWKLKKADRIEYNNSIIEIHQEYLEKFKKSINELNKNVKIIYNLFYKSTNVML